KGIGMKAYHGSNKIFDQFDPTKAGEGVGAHLICKGINLTTRPALADTYRLQVSTPDAEFTDKLYYSRNDSPLIGDTEEIDFLRDQLMNDLDDEALSAAEDRLEELGVEGEASYGAVYEVIIPDREHLI